MNLVQSWNQGRCDKRCKDENCRSGNCEEKPHEDVVSVTETSIPKVKLDGKVPGDGIKTRSIERVISKEKGSKEKVEQVKKSKVDVISVIETSNKTNVAEVAEDNVKIKASSIKGITAKFPKPDEKVEGKVPGDGVKGTGVSVLPSPNLFPSEVEVKKTPMEVKMERERRKMERKLIQEAKEEFCCVC